MEGGIYFDEDFRVRVLDVGKYATSTSIQENTQQFTRQVQELQGTVCKYLAVIEHQAEAIEREKLSAVGLRNQVASLNEERVQREKELKQLLAERQEELDRLQVEELSLLKLLQEQQQMIAKLSDSTLGEDAL